MYRGKTFLIILFIIVLILSLCSTQEQLEDFKAQFQPKEYFLYLPSGKLIKTISLGFDELVADFLFIKATLYFGSHYLTDREYIWLYHLLDVATTLSPHFKDIYEFGAIVLSFEVGQVDNSLALLEKGIENNPQYWRFPFYAGFNCFYFKEDYKQAANYIQRASLLPGCPSYLPGLAARLYAEAGQPEFAMEFLEEILQDTQDERLRGEIEDRIKRLRVEVDLNVLEATLQEFRQRFNRDPKDLKELVSSGLLKEIPQEPFGGRYFLKNSNVINPTFPERLKVYR